MELLSFGHFGYQIFLNRQLRPYDYAMMHKERKVVTGYNSYVDLYADTGVDAQGKNLSPYAAIQQIHKNEPKSVQLDYALQYAKDKVNNAIDTMVEMYLAIGIIDNAIE